MVDAFATVDDLALRLNRVFTDGAVADWITALLEDASSYLRDDVLGQQVYPQSQSTFTAWPDAGRVDIPQAPLISIDAVTYNSAPVRYSQRDNSIMIHWQGEQRVLNDIREPAVDITFTYGYTTPPDSLVRWTCVLVSQVLVTLAQNLGLTAGGLSSVSIDDFKAAFADAGDNTGITLSDRNIQLLREQFGVKSAYVVSSQ